MVSAETAMAMPALVLVTLLCLFGIAAGESMLQAGDAARLTARAYARGDGALSAHALGAKVAPPGSAVTVRPLGGEVIVTISTPLRRPGVLQRMLPRLTIHESARAPMELP